MTVRVKSLNKKEWKDEESYEGSLKLPERAQRFNSDDVVFCLCGRRRLLFAFALVRFFLSLLVARRVRLVVAAAPGPPTLPAALLLRHGGGGGRLAVGALVTGILAARGKKNKIK